MQIPILLLVAIGSISLVFTMVGLGGGLLFSPLFIMLGMAKSDAAAASLFLNLIAAASAATTYARKGMVDYSLAIPLIIASAVAAPVGAYFNLKIDLQPFLLILAVILVLAGGRMLMKPPSVDGDLQVGAGRKVAGGLVIGGLIGLVGGLLGIGGGVFMVPLLIYLLKTPTKIAAASSAFIVCFSSLTGFLGYASMVTLDWRFILPAAVASFIGGQIGSRIMSAGLNPKVIRTLFSVLLFGMALRLFFQAVGS